MSLLNEIQQKLKVPKSQYNAFAKYNYRNAEDILEAVKPLLGKNELYITDEVVQIGERYYVKATATLIEYLKWGEGIPTTVNWICSGWAREELDKKGMDAAQITGAASSYARKYALNGLFCIDDTKDADHDDGNAASAPKAPQTAKSAPQRTETSETENREKAKRDRTKWLLGKLGYDMKNPSLADVAEAISKEVSLDLSSDDLDVINEALASKTPKK